VSTIALAPGTTAIKAEDLQLSYARSGFTLHLPSLRVGRGEVLTIIGPSGCGKTTLLDCLAGIHRPQRGTIQIGEQDLSALNETQRRDFRLQRIGMVFQDFCLLDHLNLEENILLPYRLSTALRLTQEVRQRARQLAGAVQLADRLGDRVNHLSQGERQRVMICRALITKPPLIFADEATSNLDPVSTRLIEDLLLAIVAEQRATLLSVSHDPAAIARADRVLDLARPMRAS
jgi:putative ABC transport system ATP-binding protein